MDRVTPSPEPVSVYSLIHSRMSAGFPKKGALLHMGKSINTSTQKKMYFDLHTRHFFLSNAPHVLDGLRGLPSWPWQKCNRLLSLGRP